QRACFVLSRYAGKEKMPFASNGEISELGALAKLCDKPVRLASASSPSLRLVVWIGVLCSARFAAAATAKQLRNRKAALFSQLRQCLLYFRTFAIACSADRLLNFRLELDEILQRQFIDIGGGHPAVLLKARKTKAIRQLPHVGELQLLFAFH